MPRSKHSHRIISGLISARKLTSRPAGIPFGRPRGAKAAGMRYQRLFEAALALEFPASGVEIGPWFEYFDVNGRGYCQPDAIIYDIAWDSWLICEIKLTDYDRAKRQMTELYVPVLQKALGTPIRRLAILRNVTNVPPGVGIYEDLRRAIRESGIAGALPVFHWLGRGRLSHSGAPKATLPASPLVEA
jgi:hypothetical protein